MSSSLLSLAKQLQAFVDDLVDVGGEERRGPYSAEAKWDNVKVRARQLVAAIAAAEVEHQELVLAANALTDACEKDMTSPDTNTFPDEDSVGGGVDNDFTLTFGMIRRTRAALNALKTI